MSHRWTELKIDLTKTPAKLLSGTKVFQREVGVASHLSVILACEPDSKERLWWHVSVSHRYHTEDGEVTDGRRPTWQELREVVYELFPEVTGVKNVLLVEMFAPPGTLMFSDIKANHIVHLWEVPKELAVD